jgi:hypothetical protein
VVSFFINDDDDDDDDSASFSSPSSMEKEEDDKEADLLVPTDDDPLALVVLVLVLVLVLRPFGSVVDVVIVVVVIRVAGILCSFLVSPALEPNQKKECAPHTTNGTIKDVGLARCVVVWRCGRVLFSSLLVGLWDLFLWRYEKREREKGERLEVSIESNGPPKRETCEEPPRIQPSGMMWPNHLPPPQIARGHEPSLVAFV